MSGESAFKGKFLWILRFVRNGPSHVAIPYSLTIKFTACNVVSLFFSARHEIYELHVHLGQETQDSLSQDLWKKVKKQLNFTLDNEDIDLELGKDFDLDWVDGRGVITCIKENTVDIFIKMIQDFKIKGQKFRAWRHSSQ